MVYKVMDQGQRDKSSIDSDRSFDFRPMIVKSGEVYFLCLQTVGKEKYLLEVPAGRLRCTGTVFTVWRVDRAANCKNLDQYTIVSKTKATLLFSLLLSFFHSISPLYISHSLLPPLSCRSCVD